MITQKEFNIDNCIDYLASNSSAFGNDQLFHLREVIKNATPTQNKKPITQTEIKNILRYNELTGEFSWLDGANKSCPVGNFSNGYIVITLNCIGYRAHRLAWLYVNGSFPNNQIDHINGIRDDNRIINLRDVTQAVNAKNSKIASNNTSGFKGVEWIPNRNKWRALISSKGKKINLGSHLCKIDAVAAVIKARREHGFHENHGRA